MMPPPRAEYHARLGPLQARPINGILRCLHATTSGRGLSFDGVQRQATSARPGLVGSLLEERGAYLPAPTVGYSSLNSFPNDQGGAVVVAAAAVKPGQLNFSEPLFGELLQHLLLALPVVAESELRAFSIRFGAPLPVKDPLGDFFQFDSPDEWIVLPVAQDLPSLGCVLGIDVSTDATLSRYPAIAITI